MSAKKVNGKELMASAQVKGGETRIKPLGHFLRFGDLLALTGLSKSTLFSLQDPDSDQFDASMPAPYQLTARTKLWKTVEVLAWIESRAVMRLHNQDSGLNAPGGVQ